MCGHNCLSLAVETSDALLHVDSVSCESILDGLVVSVCELMVLTVGEPGTGLGIGSSCGVMASLTAVV